MDEGTDTQSFPNWAQSGRKGLTKCQINVFGLCHERSNLFVHSAHASELEPTTMWYKEDEAGNRVEITNHYIAFQRVRSDDPLPPGWSHHLGEETDEPFYRYSKAPGYTFWHSLPERVQTDGMTLNRRWTTALFLKAWRSYLSLGQRFSGDELEAARRLNTADGGLAGTMYCHFESDYSSKTPRDCELVVISHGRACGNKDNFEWAPEMNLERASLRVRWYAFYHVIWIEWNGRYATRRGLGRVKRSVRENLQVECIDLELG